MAQVAIEYGSSRLRLLEFDGTGRKVRVLNVTDVDLRVAAVGSGGEDDDADAERAERIAAAVDDSGVTNDPSAMAFDAGHALFREFDLPFTNDEQLNKVVRFEAESHIPLDIDEVVLQHLVLRKTRDKSHILAVAIKKDELLDRFDILDESDIDPMLVDIDVFALYNALSATGVAEEHGVQVVVDAQESSTSLLFLVEGKLFAVRSLRMGTQGIHSFDDAETELDREIDTARAHDYLGRLKREVRRTLTTLPSLGEIEAALITGSGCRIPGFAEAVSEAFGVETEPVDLLAHVDHKLSDADVARYGLDIGVVLGMAYKLNGFDVTGSDFRREECAYTRKFDQVKTPLIVLSFLLFSMAAFFAIESTLQYRKVEQEYRMLIANARVQLEELMEDNEAAAAIYEGKDFGAKQVQAIYSAVNGMFDEKSRMLGRSQTIPNQASALAAWIEFSKLIAENEDELGRLKLDRLEISVSDRTPTIKIAGVMESGSNYNRLIDLLTADPLFMNVQTGAVDFQKGSFSETVAEIDIDELRSRGES